MISSISENVIHFRYKPNRKHFRGMDKCPVFRSFDLVLWKPESRQLLILRRIFVRNVLCLPNRDNLRFLHKFRFLLKNITLVIAGEDTNLSKLLPEIEALIPYCRSIYIEAKDIRHDKIKSLPMGLISYYIDRVGEKHFLEKISDARRFYERKEGVLASWGGIWSNLDNTITERGELAKFIEKTPWLRREQLSASDYIHRLSTSKYFFAPRGQGIQSPKLAEAWLVRTVPIVIKNPCFEDLEELGFPFLMVDSWDQVSQALLGEFEPIRQAINWEKVISMLTIEFFEGHILGKGRLQKSGSAA